MANVIHREKKEFRKSVNTPEYSEQEWIINPDMSNVAGVEHQYWKISGDDVLEMNPIEKAVVIGRNFNALKESTKEDLLSSVDEEVIGTTEEYDLMKAQIDAATNESRLHNLQWQMPTVNDMVQVGEDGYIDPALQDKHAENAVIFHVNNARIDEFTEVGSEQRPFKTIYRAFVQVIINGDNSMTRPYIFYIHPGIYYENMSVEHPALVHIVFYGMGDHSFGKTADIRGKFSLRNYNNNFKKLVAEYVSLTGEVFLEGSSNGSTFLEEGFFVRHTTCNGNMTMKNLGRILVNDCQLNGDLTLENVKEVVICGYPGQDHYGSNKLIVRWDDSKNIPAGATGSEVRLQSTDIGELRIEKIGTTGTVKVEPKMGACLGTSTSTHYVGDGCVLKDEGGCYIPGKIVMEQGGTWENNSLAFNADGCGLESPSIQEALRELSLRVGEIDGIFKFNSGGPGVVCCASAEVEITSLHYSVIGNSEIRTICPVTTGEVINVGNRCVTVTSNLTLSGDSEH